MMQKYFFWVSIVLFLVCCQQPISDKAPENLLSKEKMSNILADMHMIESMSMQHPRGGDTNVVQLHTYYEDIYKHHQVTETDFKTSYDYYLHHPVLLDSVYSDVITLLSSKEALLRTKIQK
jgi:hypothetical protein